MQGEEYTAQELYEKVSKEYDLRSFHSVSLTGGEPLLHAEFLKEFLPLIKEETKIYLETNATLPKNLEIIKDYIDIIQKVARVEYRRIPAHMVECEELVSIGIIAIQALIKNKSDEQLEKYNTSYIGTAVRWAIRNELRNRYKWYTLKHKKDTVEDEEETPNDNVSSLDVSPTKVREAIYETILSIDSIASASSDTDSPLIL